ncbi:MAG TPA: DNA primase catalytic subunit PriS [Methanothermococcus okinawensis]|uniref:DNA primase small subunit PriS n=1 Tax=Methanothermococcus okinawensis TaxID=155863 RepID=A0A833DZW8_9EURY|nr:DNA primase catalytic subunit PriS [Methanothermococcus okinawensis]
METSHEDKLDLIKKYYREFFRDAVKNRWLEVPEDIKHREIGYGYLKKVDNRNLSFNSQGEYLNWVLDRSPFHLYKSLAYMRYPSSVGGAQKKGLFRREIAFDIDVHKLKRCTHRDQGWLCRHCLEEGKKQVFILIDEFLIPDFGLSKRDLKIVFSGNRGYHIYIKPRDEDIRDTIEHWSREERRYFIEYILGKNLSLSSVGSGWKRRILKAIKNRRLLAQLERSSNWRRILERLREKERKRIVSIIEKVKNRLELDEKVMEDDIRLLRVIGSLHGYTGFMVKEIKYNSLEHFDPLRDGIYPKFNREYYNVKIKERIDPLRIGDNLYTYRSKEVPVSVILYLFGHGVDFEILD